MLRVNGLFGWIQSNDHRSLLLFGGFVLALQFAAALVLYLPLAAFDAAHAPFTAWSGYAVRYAPIVAVLGVASFAAQMAWHVHAVRKIVPFEFVDNAEEPRLCEIVELIAMTMGLPAPYVGVIESGALNAFACGVRRGDAVVVVTRGLIDGLDDEELGAVVAHELAHIANADIRLIAAANICLGMLRRVILPNRRRPHPLVEIVGPAATLFIMPPMFFAVMLVGFLTMLPVRLGRGVHRLIGVSREFVADAMAVETTQNPAALVSALRRIHGRSLIAGMPTGADAMMIDGAAAGGYSTHPSIADRVKAIIAVTGSMATISPSRRDTRHLHQRGAGFGVRPQPEPAAAPVAALAADPYENRNWLGISNAATAFSLAALVVFVGWRGYAWRDPARVAAQFDPRPAIDMTVYTVRQLGCGVGANVGLPRCGRGELDAMAKRLSSQGGAIGGMMAEVSSDDLHRFRNANGMLSDSAPPEMITAEVKAQRCFVTDGYTVGAFGLHPVATGEDADENYDIERWLTSANLSARAVAAQPAPTDAALADYLTRRKDRLRMVHAYFGEPGLRYALDRFGEGDHATALAAIRARVADPKFAAAFGPVAAAEMQLLAEDPASFVPCRARKAAPAAAGLRRIG